MSSAARWVLPVMLSKSTTIFTCGREDLNLHPVARTSTSSWRVYLIPPRPHERAANLADPEPHLFGREGPVHREGQVLHAVGDDGLGEELGDRHDREVGEDLLLGLLVLAGAGGGVGLGPRRRELLVDLGHVEARGVVPRGRAEQRREVRVRRRV